MSKQQLIITKGIPGSGKTTWARNWVNEDPLNRIRINRDDIRRMVGPYWIPEREGVVNSIEVTSVMAALNKGCSVVIDSTGFRWDESSAFKIVDSQNKNSLHHSQLIEVIVKDFTDVPLEVCIDRDSKRPEPVGADVITAQYNKYVIKL